MDVVIMKSVSKAAPPLRISRLFKVILKAKLAPVESVLESDPCPAVTGE
jgi:hypothetical protein